MKIRLFLLIGIMSVVFVYSNTVPLAMAEVSILEKTGIQISESIVCKGIESPSAMFAYEILPDNSIRIIRVLSKDINIIPEIIDGRHVSTIAGKAFLSAWYGSIEIPNTVTIIESNPFSGYIAQRIVVSGNHPTLEVIDGVLFSKPDHRLVCASRDAYENSHYVVPDGTEIIDDFAFYNCDFDSITIPNSVKKLGINPFAQWHSGEDYQTAETQIILQFNHPVLEIINGILFSKPENRLIWCVTPDQNEYAYTIPVGIERIDDFAFQRWLWLESVVLPQSICDIGVNPFYGLSNFKRVVIPDNHAVLEFDNGILINKLEHRLICCTHNVLDYEIPYGTEIIGAYAFAGIKHENTIKIRMPQSVTEIGEYAFAYSSFSENIPAAAKTIGEGAFMCCAGLTCDIVLTGDVVIDAYAFSESSVSSLTIIGRTALIGYRAFDCTNLEEVTIHCGTSVIGDYSLYGCEHLKQVSFSEGLKAIGFNAFLNCSSIQMLTIPSTVNFIGNLYNTQRKTYLELYDTYASESICTMSIFVTPDSYAEKYCQDNHIDYCCMHNL